MKFMPKSPEQNNIEKSRANSDTELIRNGAELIVGDEEGERRIKVNEKQKNTAKTEMEYTINDKEKAKQEAMDALRVGNIKQVEKVFEDWDLAADFLDSTLFQEAVSESVSYCLQNGLDNLVPFLIRDFHAQISEQHRKIAADLAIRNVISGRLFIIGDHLEDFNLKEYFSNQNKEKLVQELLASIDQTNNPHISNIDYNINHIRDLFGLDQKQIEMLNEKIVISGLRSNNSFSIISAVNLKDQNNFDNSPEMQSAAIDALKYILEYGSELVPILLDDHRFVPKKNKPEFIRKAAEFDPRFIDMFDNGQKIVRDFKIDKQAAKEIATKVIYEVAIKKLIDITKYHIDKVRGGYYIDNYQSEVANNLLKIKYDFGITDEEYSNIMKKVKEELSEAK